MPDEFAYTLALTEAIEAWSASVMRADPHAFFHRGADLRHAAERSLFFELVNDAALRARFGATGQVKVEVPSVGLLRRLKSEAGNLSRLLRPAFTAARLQEKPVFLFLAIHPKFVTFLKPIADELGANAAYLTVADKVTEAHLERSGLPAVAVQQAFTPRPVRWSANSHWIYVSRDFDQISVMMEKLKPSVIVVPEGNAPVYEIAHRAGLQQGVATVYMQHGAHGYTNPGFRNWTFEDAIMWGSQFVEPFAKYNPQQKFTVIGTPVTFGVPQPRSREPIRAVGFFLQKSAAATPPREWEAMLAFIGWLARSFPDIEVLVREHPSLPRLDEAEMACLGTPQNLRFVPPPQFGLSDVLSMCDVVVSGASTTLLEAVAVGAMPFILGTIYPPDFPAIAPQGAALKAPTLEAAQQAMAELIGDADLRARLRAAGERLRPELFASVGQVAAVRIAAYLRGIAGKSAAGGQILSR